MRLLLLLLAFTFANAAVAQQNFPTRPLRMVIPWPPGQATDLVGRIVAQKLSEILGQQVIADNRPGAGGMIGTDVVAKATPDGYILLAASSGPISINPLVQKTPYDVERELAPVANVAVAPFMLVSAVKFPAQNAQEFVTLLKANPGKYTFSSSGTGATAHLITEIFNGLAGIQARHVPYKGSSPAIIDVIAGEIAYTLETVSATFPYVKANRLRGYGLSIARTSIVAPGIEPLAKLLNLPGMDVAAWIGVMVPAGTPKPLIARLTAAVDQAMQQQDTREKLALAGLEVDYRKSEEFGGYLKDYKVRFADTIKKNNIKIE